MTTPLDCFLVAMSSGSSRGEEMDLPRGMNVFRPAMTCADGILDILNGSNQMMENKMWLLIKMVRGGDL